MSCKNSGIAVDWRICDSSPPQKSHRWRCWIFQGTSRSFPCETGFSESRAGAPPCSSRAGLDSARRGTNIAQLPQAPGRMLNLLLGTAFLIFTVKKLKRNKSSKGKIITIFWRSQKVQVLHQNETFAHKSQWNQMIVLPKEHFERKL